MLLADDDSIDMMDSVVSLHNEMLFRTIKNQNTMTKSGLPSKDQLTFLREQLGGMNNMSASETMRLIQGRTASSKNWKEVSEAHTKSTNSLTRSLSADVSGAPVDCKTSCPQEFGAFKKKVQHSEKMLKEAFVEFHRGLGLLKSYRFYSCFTCRFNIVGLCMTMCRQILKRL